MSTQNKQTDNTVDNQPHEEVDYADPESPTLAIRQLSSPTTGPTERQTDALETNEFVYTPGTDLPGMGGTTLATPAEEAPTKPMTSSNSQRRSGDGQLLNDDEVMVYSLSHPPMKRRRLDLGELMVKTTSSAKPISDKPVEHFRTVRRPEITRLAETDPMPPPTANKSMGRGSGKDGRPLVSDLIQDRETEATL